ncbi:MAG: helix-turn-helix domain-containing protein [Oscillospiraceae bacterium]
MINGITSDAMRALIDYDWPGNVRELRNTIERGVVTSDNGYIELRNLPNDISKLNLTSTVAKTASDVKAPASPPLRHAAETDSVDSNYLHYRSNLAKALMEEHGGNKALVARSMGISRSTLYRILNEIQD